MVIFTPVATKNEQILLQISSDLIVDHLCFLSIAAQSNFAVGAVVNATFGSVTELTFYITALLKGRQEANPCLQEVVKAALTGTLLGCILFIPVSQLLNDSRFYDFTIKKKQKGETTFF